MRKLRSHSSASHTDRTVKKARTKQRGSVGVSAEVPRRWKWHCKTLALMRDRLIEERNEALSEAAERSSGMSVPPGGLGDERI